MASSAQAPVEDHSELRSREQSIEIGSRLMLAAAAAALAYAVATWGEPRRALVAALLGLLAAWSLAPLAAGAGRMVRSARREPLFLGWSVGYIVLIAALVIADGGAGSAFALLFFVPLPFAALSSPLPWVALIGTLDVLAFVVTGLGAGGATQPQLAFFAAVLAITALMCAWEAADHDRQ